eukprot:TRINITY_DN2102_c0_g1_i3.p1 TRINITY_DN2102_c0_g1~~TRINITY_DN2102_c0_g1_i3.p1  ORF type:complete len:423 (+),score=67.93 TRINITY_DN2102_c0_g1_i3:66-1334(+)
MAAPQRGEAPPQLGSQEAARSGLSTPLPAASPGGESGRPRHARERPRGAAASAAAARGAGGQQVDARSIFPSHGQGERPCSHNNWDNVRMKEYVSTLRCRVCQALWRVHCTRRNRCADFDAGQCAVGTQCPSTHINRRKERLDERRERFGEHFVQHSTGVGVDSDGRQEFLAAPASETGSVSGCATPHGAALLAPPGLLSDDGSTSACGLSLHASSPTWGPPTLGATQSGSGSLQLAHLPPASSGCSSFHAAFGYFAADPAPQEPRGPAALSSCAAPALATQQVWVAPSPGLAPQAAAPVALPVQEAAALRQPADCVAAQLPSPHLSRAAMQPQQQQPGLAGLQRQPGSAAGPQVIIELHPVQQQQQPFMDPLGFPPPVSTFTETPHHAPAAQLFSAVQFSQQQQQPALGSRGLQHAQYGQQ